MMYRLGLALSCLLCLVAAQSQVNTSLSDELAIQQWQSLKENRDRDPQQTLAQTDPLLAHFSLLADSCKLADVLAMRGICFEQLGKLDSSLTTIHRSFDLFQPSCDSVVLMRSYVALSNFYLGSVFEPQLSDSVCSLALASWNPAWSASELRNSLWMNLAIAKAGSNDLDGATKGFRTAYQLAHASGDTKDADDALSNLGVLKAMVNELDSAEHYFRIALTNAKLGSRFKRLVNQYENLAWLAGHKGSYKKSIAYSDSALVIAKQIGDLAMQVQIEHRHAGNYSLLDDHEQAYAHLLLHKQLSDSLLNSEKLTVITELEERYENEKNLRKIKELQVQNLDSDLLREKADQQKNILFFSVIAIVLLAGALWGRLRYMRKSRAAISAEKDVSEGLLYNILPEQVAEELRVTGHAKTTVFNNATVLFTDFKQFTELSAIIPPVELVEQIDACFKAFDGVMEKHGVEKIKTFGDAYMAAGGLPDGARSSTVDVVLAAIDLRNIMRQHKVERTKQGKPFFEMRIGLHTGPVIAGVVGVKKFQYDIWGDTVNAASRMESAGAVDQVNISAATFNAIRDDQQFSFTSRGMVPVKGKGEMNMYFVDLA